MVLYVKTRKSPEEIERLRRLHISARGRLADGFLVERMDREGRFIIRYDYEVGQVTYHSAQDVSSIKEKVNVDDHCDGLPTRVKYLPQNPGDSIVVCEDWSGLDE